MNATRGEYKILNFAIGRRTQAEQRLTELAAEGWEVVTMTLDANRYGFLLRREVPNERWVELPEHDDRRGGPSTILYEHP